MNEKTGRTGSKNDQRVSAVLTHPIRVFVLSNIYTYFVICGVDFKRFSLHE